MKETLVYRMENARSELIQSVNTIMKDTDLPAFIMSEIVADVLGDLRQAAKLELLREMEVRDDESVQPDRMEE